MDKKLMKFSNFYDYSNYDEIIDDILDKINYSINLITANRPMFKPENFTYYNYDEYILETNNNVYNPINFYICLDKDENRKVIDKKYDKTIAPSLHFELDEFRDELYNNLITLFDNSYMLGKDKYGIKITNKEFAKQNNLLPISYYIVPCIKYTNKNNVNGNLFYTKNRKFIDINYSEKAVENFKNKDEETNYLLSTYTKLFKNIYMDYYDLEDLPFDMFEVLMYNVPKEMFKEISFENGKEITNYLLNKDLKTFKTIDEEDSQFYSKYKSLSRLYAKKVIKTLNKLMNNQDHKIFNE